jgi:GTP-binding protein
MSPELIKKQMARLKKAAGKMPVLLSAASGQGVTETLRELFKIITSSGGGTAAKNKQEKAAAWQP